MPVFYRVVFGLLVVVGFALSGSPTLAQTNLASISENYAEAQPAQVSAPASYNRFMGETILAGLLFAGALGFVLLAMGKDKSQPSREVLPARPITSAPDLMHIQLKEKQLQEAIESRDMELELRDMELRLSKQELEFRNKELTTFTLHMVQKNSMLEELRECIQEIAPSQKDASPKLKRLVKLIDYSFNLDKDWDEFKMYFEQVHKDFFVQLKEQYPSLSSNELRLCALLKLNLSVKEMASLMGISPESVKMARHRLRKKLGLTSEQNLTEFMQANAITKSSDYAARIGWLPVEISVNTTAGSGLMDDWINN